MNLFSNVIKMVAVEMDEAVGAKGVGSTALATESVMASDRSRREAEAALEQALVGAVGGGGGGGGGGPA